MAIQGRARSSARVVIVSKSAGAESRIAWRPPTAKNAAQRHCDRVLQQAANRRQAGSPGEIVASSVNPQCVSAPIVYTRSIGASLPLGVSCPKKSIPNGTQRRPVFIYLHAVLPMQIVPGDDPVFSRLRLCPGEGVLQTEPLANNGRFLLVREQHTRARTP